MYRLLLSVSALVLLCACVSYAEEGEGEGKVGGFKLTPIKDILDCMRTNFRSGIKGKSLGDLPCDVTSMITRNVNATKIARLKSFASRFGSKLLRNTQDAPRPAIGASEPEADELPEGSGETTSAPLSLGSRIKAHMASSLKAAAERRQQAVQDTADDETATRPTSVLGQRVRASLASGLQAARDRKLQKAQKTAAGNVDDVTAVPVSSGSFSDDGGLADGPSSSLLSRMRSRMAAGLQSFKNMKQRLAQNSDDAVDEDAGAEFSGDGSQSHAALMKSRMFQNYMNMRKKFQTA